jgi:hypothetical protein
MAEILDILGREFIGFIRHVHSPSGLVCCGASRIGTMVSTTPTPTAYPTRSGQTGKDGSFIAGGQIPGFSR